MSDPKEPLVDGKHVTLGRKFRTPAHPDVLVALGRAQYTFLSLEESVTAILYDAGAATLPETRGKMAHAKGQALRDLAATYREHPDGLAVAESIDAAFAAFDHARDVVRNKLSHAHPFTAGQDAHGSYLPGLAYTAKDGKSWRTLAATPEDLLNFATEIERAITPLGAARRAVKAMPLADLI
ncbi:hypothetical protein [Microbacterium sp. BLY]|uniref:hypothetical protein n=1 Tax=Microbacterium sp. BLY TaxID=2823280 RepID=UPI001B329086|nr:hypothetical protein [Microbacterium sp. BLY]MBP3978497.1 hypothetical protein [Microbacterium sp. BLY]